MKRSPVIPLAHILGSLWQRESVPVIETFMFASSRLGFEAQPGCSTCPPSTVTPGCCGCLRSKSREGCSVVREVKQRVSSIIFPFTCILIPYRWHSSKECIFYYLLQRQRVRTVAGQPTPRGPQWPWAGGWSPEGGTHSGRPHGWEVTHHAIATSPRSAKQNVRGGSQGCVLPLAPSWDAGITPAFECTKHLFNNNELVLKFS